MNDDERLESLARDRARQCGDRYMITNMGFLDMRQQSQLRKSFRREPAPAGVKPFFWGGYEEAERQVLFFLPEYASEEDVREEIRVLRADCSVKAAASGSGRPPAHGDYLGSLMGLGIDRDRTGDILVREDGADILILAEISEFLEMNFVSAGRTNLSVSVHPAEDLILPVRERVRRHDTVASLRLDNLVSSAFGLSRAKAAEAIKRGLVFVDHQEVLKPDAPVEAGAVVNLRHHGKVRLLEVGGRSRKDRINIDYEIY